MIELPQGAVRCSAAEAIRILREGDYDILATLKDENGGIYAAHSFTNWMLDDEKGYSIDFFEIADFIENGIWYALESNKSQEPLDISKEHILVNVVGGIVNSVMKCTSVEDGIAKADDFYRNSFFDPETDDSRIFEVKEDGSCEEVHSYEPAEVTSEDV